MPKSQRRYVSCRQTPALFTLAYGHKKTWDFFLLIVTWGLRLPYIPNKKSPRKNSWAFQTYSYRYVIEIVEVSSYQSISKNALLYHLTRTISVLFFLFYPPFCEVFSSQCKDMNFPTLKTYNQEYENRLRNVSKAGNLPNQSNNCSITLESFWKNIM